MKASELIKRLQELMDEHGDQLVFYGDDESFLYETDYIYVDDDGDFVISD